MSEDRKLNLKLRVGGKYVTRGGEVVEVAENPSEGPHSDILFKFRVLRLEPGDRYMYNVTEDGYYWGTKSGDYRDLVTEYVEPESGTHILYLNVYRCGVKVHKFLEDAEAWAGPDRIRCEVIQVKY